MISATNDKTTVIIDIIVTTFVTFSLSSVKRKEKIDNKLNI